MNVNKMYIPNTQKWINFYQNLGTSGHNPYINYAHKPGRQIGGGSLTGSPRQFIMPVGLPHKDTNHDDKLTVKLVSPVQQSTDQAKDEVERENMKQGIKRKRSQQSFSPTRKRPRKQTQKVKKNKKKTLVKRHKKTKKTITKPTKQSRKKKSIKKKKLLKSSFKDIFS